MNITVYIKFETVNMVESKKKDMKIIKIVRGINIGDVDYTVDYELSSLHNGLMINDTIEMTMTETITNKIVVDYYSFEHDHEHHQNVPPQYKCMILREFRNKLKLYGIIKNTDILNLLIDNPLIVTIVDRTEDSVYPYEI